ncbi:hypothetical protein HBI56_147390 [Parastagonospora nodorum]|nr:hypothetical protein HBH52_071950 [Parastagonospora nodorum]KAH4023839.1 hypothetical protein HBI09_164730 [Parastagonospora nodorum]KAH4173675.1 hypothetical protein HBH43_080940 [Parastagonospora nodorum]KAH4210015.1 hypothetical protein HBI95_069160 [Parastagonospora nodorum]KAH4848418.1 hypothetical protein HBH75_153350 [Parastagonospora nodorum]
MNAHNAHEALYPFSDNIVIQDKPSSIYYGRAASEQGIIERCLVICIDTSVHAFPPTKKASRLSALTIRLLHSSSKRWGEMITFNTVPHGSRFAIEAEFVAIHEAFRVACGLTEEYDRLIIFSDCQH